jgi:hypothetical protein
MWREVRVELLFLAAARDVNRKYNELDRCLPLAALGVSRDTEGQEAQVRK